MQRRYRGHRQSVFPLRNDRPSDGTTPEWRAPTLFKEPPMTKLSKTLIAAAAFASIATAALSQVVWEFNPGMAYMYAGPGKMSAMAMASGQKNHDAMMKNAAKVPNNTVFFMHNNELYSVSGTLDPTGNFYRP
jgi:hypothetical protein